MSNHKISHHRSEREPVQFQARCSCRKNSGWHEHPWQAEDWERAHLAEVARIRSHLEGRNPSLESQRAYYLAKATEPGVSDSYRAMWQQLADEVGHRLGDVEDHYSDDVPLF
jgi:hypothetical protein